LTLVADKTNRIQHPKNMKKLICLVVLATALTAKAQNTEAYQNFLPGGYPVNLTGYTFGTAGWSFQPLTDVSVTALGSFDYLVTGFRAEGYDPAGLDACNQARRLASAVTGQRRGAPPAWFIVRFKGYSPRFLRPSSRNLCRFCSGDRSP
jgi:hypothetical protein